MVLLPALLLLCVVPLSSGTDRLRTKFYLEETQKQINDVLSACKTKYTDLVTIYDKEKNITQAKMLVNGSSNCSLIGANGCTWSNGEPVTFINLSRNFTEERCCGALTTGGTWKCVNCSSRMNFMCYKKDTEPSFNYSLIPENKTWFEAQLYCRENHTDLVSIRNKRDNERVKEAVNGNNSIWIGLQYNYRVAWFDDGRFYKEKCFTFLSNHPTESCKNNQSTCAALCYKRFIHVSECAMSWEDGLDYCKNDSKTDGLLRIESEDDHTETEQELERQKISGPVWVGLRQSRLFGFWIWDNGLYVGPWTNWKEGSAPKHLLSQHCGALEKVNGTFKWTDKDCSRYWFKCTESHYDVAACVAAPLCFSFFKC
ncbi:hypothetical protein Q8A67_013060 [Cirrhinus molitorella]|uniref:C-type lectin domain-containing protein n=1 Tax=Cirrhinus molitorella TaxID=172907 RepID=A0AA88TMZ8_9TELE|nr:hypothetical protein Q8A67_013060 [Cirrhinus molitorella]